MTGPDAELARALADEAGRALLEIRAEGLTGDELKAAGDRGAQHVLAKRLAAERPDDEVLSEEAADSPARLASSRVWIVDPLDGTREFAEPGREDWAVHVALWVDGELTAGAVALPATGETYATDRAPEVAPGLDDASAGSIRFVVSRSRPPAFVAALAGALGGELVPMGSAGAKTAAVWRGQADAYVHAGGQYEWDSAAPVAVARAAGLHTSRIDGSPLQYNRSDPWLPDLLVCRPGLAAPILAAIAAARDSTAR